MYLILVKYFYYFYYLKKNKKFKFFILIDLIFFLMKKYFKLLLLKKKLMKYKNYIKKIEFLKNNNFNSSKNIYFLVKLDLFLKQKIESYNNFIINFLPTQLLPLGNRKKFYNLINKKFKRFFILIKKKLNKKFFFFYLVQMFRKVKFLFIKSDAFLNKKNFLFDFFSVLSLESKYDSLLQVYKQHNKKDNFLKNRFVSFFNMISFFLYRIDYFLFKSFSFFSLEEIRSYIFNTGVFINNKRISSIYFFLNKYDLVSLPLLSKLKLFYIFSLKYYFDLVNKYIYKKNNDLKLNYYLELYKKIKNKNEKWRFLKLKKNVKLVNINISYTELMDQIYSFFFKIKKNKYNSFYTFDTLNRYKNNYKIEFQFPFFLKQKKKDLFFNTNANYLCNISYKIKNTTSLNKNNIFNFSYLINFINLYFFLFKYKYLYYHTFNNKLIVSPLHINKIVEEQKKLFYYFTVIFHINLTKLI